MGKNNRKLRKTWKTRQTRQTGKLEIVENRGKRSLLAPLAGKRPVNRDDPTLDEQSTATLAPEASNQLNVIRQPDILIF